MSVERVFTRLTAASSDFAGKPGVFVVMCGLVLLWAASGPWFNYSDTWQLVINTGTTIITCLLALLIQASQNRSEVALQAKLDELLSSDNISHRRMIGIEHLTLSELEKLRDELERMVKG